MRLSPQVCHAERGLYNIHDWGDYILLPIRRAVLGERKVSLLERCPLGERKVSSLERCPHFSGERCPTVYSLMFLSFSLGPCTV